MSTIRTEEQLGYMRESGRITAVALKEVLKNVRAGITTLELDQIAQKMIIKNGGQISFQTVEDYPYATCITINDEVVHGMPRDYKLKSGDIVGIDIGSIYNGWHSDLAESVIVDPEKANPKRVQLLEVGKKALLEAISQARPGNRIGDISHAMQSIIESAGYNVVRALTGHGVGTQLHEEPTVPCFGKPGKGEELKPGMTIAIEAIYNEGSADVRWKNNDGWTIATVDGKDSGLFERTVAITENEPEILTPIDSL